MRATVPVLAGDLTTLGVAGGPEIIGRVSAVTPGARRRLTMTAPTQCC